MTYKKYVIPFKPVTDKKCEIKVVGNVITVAPVFNPDGSMSVPIEYGADFRVDIIWYDTPEAEWAEYEVVPATPDHYFLGMRGLWEEQNP